MARMRISQLVLLLCVCVVFPVHADYTSAESIRTQAQTFLKQFAEEQEAIGRSVSYEVGSLDSRLRLAQCPSPLAFEFTSDPLTRTSNTLLVSCTGERPWRLFLNANIELKDDALVSTGPLSRGTRLQESMLEKRRVIINAQRKSSYQSVKNLAGMRLKRSIGAGTLLTPDLLEAPDAVSRGDRVIISASSGPVVIETRGEALASGKIGQQIPVENLRSQRRIYGIVSAPGRVDVTM